MKKSFVCSLTLAVQMLLISHPVFARYCHDQDKRRANDIFLNCKASSFSFNKGYLVLHSPNKQLLFILHNTSNRTLYLDHPDQHLAVGAGWSTKIDAGNVSAFSLDVDRKHMPFHCMVRNHFSFKHHSPRFKTVCCEDFLSVCQIPGTRFLIGNEGTYWVADNYKDRSLFERRIEKRGVYTPQNSR